jgi:hypothetical protein
MKETGVIASVVCLSCWVGTRSEPEPGMGNITYTPIKVGHHPLRTACCTLASN